MFHVPVTKRDGRRLGVVVVADSLRLATETTQGGGGGIRLARRGAKTCQLEQVVETRTFEEEDGTCKNHSASQNPSNIDGRETYACHRNARVSMSADALFSQPNTRRNIVCTNSRQVP